MSKQEEIREGLMELLDVSTDDYYRTLEGGSLYFIASRLLDYLHSQGVKLPDGSSLIAVEPLVEGE